jgi:hypothetical protein
MESSIWSAWSSLSALSFRFSAFAKPAAASMQAKDSRRRRHEARMLCDQVS